MTPYKLHMFRPGETIDAIIKLLGRHNLTKEEIISLRQSFNELNGLVAPRPGKTYKIPTPSMEKVISDTGSVEDTKNNKNAQGESAN